MCKFPMAYFGYKSISNLNKVNEKYGVIKGSRVSLLTKMTRPAQHRNCPSAFNLALSGDLFTWQKGAQSRKHPVFCLDSHHFQSQACSGSLRTIC